MTTATATTTKLQSQLSAQNGSRRTRLLDVADIVDAAEGLRPGQFQFLRGGHVANAYKYPAWATVAVVWRDPQGRTFAMIDEASARKGSTGFGRRDSWVPPAESDPDAIRVTMADQQAAYNVDMEDCSINPRSKVGFAQASDWFAERGDSTNAKRCAAMAGAPRLIK